MTKTEKEKEYSKKLAEVKKFIEEFMNKEFDSNIAHGYNKYEALNDAFRGTLFYAWGFCGKDGTHYEMRFADIMAIMDSTKPKNYDYV